MFFCLVVTLGFLWKVEWAIDMFSGGHEVGGRSKRRWPRINAPFPEFLDGETVIEPYSHAGRKAGSGERLVQRMACER